MARQARIKSATGIYHVMLKGLDGRNIFLNDADCIFRPANSICTVISTQHHGG